MLEITGLHKSYKQRKVLDNCSFKVNPYEIHGILGMNGCGKSTLFKSIMGLIEADAGDLKLDGQLLNFENRRNFGYMPEQRSMLLDLSMREHLRYIGTLRKIEAQTLEHRIDELVDSFDIRELLDRPIHRMSKGQQQKVQLLMALLTQPKILILDEPLNGLDYDSVQFFLRHLKAYASYGNAVLISSHQMEFMDELCTHLLVLEKGKTMKQGRLEDLQAKHGITLKVNGSCQWQKLALLSDQSYDSGPWMNFMFKDMDHAQKALESLSKIKGLTRLKMQPVSMGELLKD